MKMTPPCQCSCHLVLCYCQAAAVLWQVADGCWIRLTCSCTGQGLLFFGKTQSRAGCFSTSWLTLLCQPLQLFVLFWWDMKVQLDSILNWG